MSLLRFHRLLHGCIYCLYATYPEIHSIYFRLTPFVCEYNNSSVDNNMDDYMDDNMDDNITYMSYKIYGR